MLAFLLLQLMAMSGYAMDNTGTTEIFQAAKQFDRKPPFEEYIGCDQFILPSLQRISVFQREITGEDLFSEDLLILGNSRESKSHRIYKGSCWKTYFCEKF